MHGRWRQTVYHATQVSYEKQCGRSIDTNETKNYADNNSNDNDNHNHNHNKNIGSSCATKTQFHVYFRVCVRARVCVCVVKEGLGRGALVSVCGKEAKYNAHGLNEEEDRKRTFSRKE